MEYRHICLQLLCLTGIAGSTINSNKQESKGASCDKCGPGFYVEGICSDQHQTICTKCPPGYFSDQPNFFDRCEECHSCDQEYSQKCSPTTNAKCSCFTGFLCSDNICSKCEKDKCLKGEKIKRVATLVNIGTNLTKYTYECEPLCHNHQYYHEEDNICLQRTLCSAHGLLELFAGNKTHNAICQSSGMQTIYVVVIAGFVVFNVIMVIVFFYYTSTKIKKIKTAQAEKVTTVEICPLSMEETAGPVEHKEDSFG